jgi:hypothetical protein
MSIVVEANLEPENQAIAEKINNYPNSSPKMPTAFKTPLLTRDKKI